MFKLGTASKEVYETLHKDLQSIIDLALEVSPIDFMLPEGYRSPEEQFELYKRGRKLIDGVWQIVDRRKVVTHIDGKRTKSKHNHNPSLAFDFAVYVPGKKELTYDTEHMVALASMFITIGNMLYNDGKISHKVRSGMNWDMDGEIIYDQSFVDIPHIEIIDNG